jgi:hypothetical protein
VVSKLVEHAHRASSALLATIGLVAIFAVIASCDAQRDAAFEELELRRAVGEMRQETAAAVATPGGPRILEAPDTMEGRVRDWLTTNRPDLSLRELTMVLIGEPGVGPYWQLNLTLESNTGSRYGFGLCFARLGQPITCPGSQVPAD